MEHYVMNLTLKVWRQANKNSDGRFETYEVKNISSEMSFLEMFDVLNERLVNEGKDPVAFDHDCREGCRRGGTSTPDTHPAPADRQRRGTHEDPRPHGEHRL